MEVSRQDIKYWVGFSLIPGIGRVKFSQLENYFGSLENAWKASSADLKQAGLDNISIDEYRGGLGMAFGYEDEIAPAKTLHTFAKTHPALKLIGGIYGKMKDYRKAFENLRIAAMFSPRDKKIRHNMALAYYDLGEYQYAIEQYKKILNVWPQDPKGYYQLARTYIKDKQYDNAVTIVKKGIKLDPKAFEDILKVGDLFLKEKQYPQAREVYAQAFGAKQRADLVHFKIGMVYLKMGDTLNAREEFQKGLAINPKNDQLKKKLKEFLSS